MILAQSIFLVLAISAVAFGRDNEDVINNNIRPQARTVVHEVNLNRAFDAALPNIRHYITKHEMDPMGVPDVEVPLSHLPGLLKTKLHMHHGFIQDLSTIYRTGDIVLQYSEEKITLIMNIGWVSLDLSYQYSLRYMLYSRKGDCHGRYEDVQAKFLLDFDYHNNQIDLKFFEFVDIGDFKVELEGHLADGLINKLTSVVTKVFRTQVLRLVEATTKDKIIEQIEEINDMLPSPIDLKVVTREVENIAPYRLNGLDSV